MMRAIRNRYLPRSFAGIFDQVFVYAARAAFTARSTSLSLAWLILLKTSSVAGLIVANLVFDFGSTHAPLMNNPYCGLIETTARDSGAGAYSKGLLSIVWLPYFTISLKSRNWNLSNNRYLLSFAASINHLTMRSRQF